MFPEARATLEAFHAAGGHLAMASWNHEGPIRAMLAAFGLLPRFAVVVAAWHPNKAAMLGTILAALPAIDPATALFVDDDPEGRYRGMAAAVGVQFAQMGVDVQGYADIARRLGIVPAPRGEPR